MRCLERETTFSRTLCRVTPYCYLSKMPAAEGIIEVGSFKVIFRLIGPDGYLPGIFLGGEVKGGGGLLNDLDFPLGKNYLCQKSFHKVVFLNKFILELNI